MEKVKKDLTNVRLKKNLNNQTRGLIVGMKLDCPEKSPALRTEVVFLDWMLSYLGCPHLTPPRE